MVNLISELKIPRTYNIYQINCSLTENHAYMKTIMKEKFKYY